MRPQSESLILLRRQRDQALACAWLSLMVSIAMLISNYGDHSSVIKGIRQTVEYHRKLLSGEESDLRANQAALAQTRAALEKLKSAISPGKP